MDQKTRLRLLKTSATLLMLFLSSVSGAVENWQMVDEFVLKKNQQVLIEIFDNNLDFDVMVSEGEQQVSIQNNPQGINAREFVVLKSQQAEVVFQVYIRPVYIVDFKPEFQVNITVFESNDDVAGYDQLQQVAQLWHEQEIKEKQIKAEKILMGLSKSVNQEIKQESLNLLSWMCFRLEKYQCTYDTAKQLHEITSQHRYVVFSQFLMANAKLYTNHIDEAISLYRSCLELISDLPVMHWQLLEVQIIAKLGLAEAIMAQAMGSQQDVARTLLEDAVISASELGDYTLLSDVLNSASASYTFNNEFELAESSLDLAIASLQIAGTDHGLVSIFNHKAMIYEMTGRLSESLSAYRKALNLSFIENKKGMIVNTYNNMAGVYLQLGDFTKALLYYEKSLNHYRSQTNRYGIGVALRGMGKAVRGQGLPEKALSYHRESYGMFEANNKDDLVAVSLELTEDYLALGNYDYAQKSLLFASSQTAQKSLNQTYLSSLILSAKLLLLKGETDDAEDILAELDEKASEGRMSTKMLLDKLKLKLRLHVIQKDAVKAKFVFGQVQDILKHVRTMLNFVDASMAWQDLNNEFVKIYVRSLLGDFQTEIDSTNIEQIFDVFELTQSQLLRHRRNSYLESKNSINRKKHNLVLEKWGKYIKTEREHINKVGRIEAEEQLESYMNVEKARQAYLQEVGNEYGANDDWLQHDLLPLSAIQKMVPKDEMFVRYHLQDEISIALVMTHNDSFIFELPNRLKLKHDVLELINVLQNPGLFDVNGPIRTLTSILPMRLIKEKRIKSLVIIPDGFLYKLPFSSLNISEDPQSYKPLVVDYDLTKTYSANDFYNNYKPQTPVSTPLVSVFADPFFLQASGGEKADKTTETDLLSSFSELSNTSNEAEMIQSIFGPDKTYVVAGKEATNNVLLSDKMRNSSILHIATHAFIDQGVANSLGFATSFIQSEEINSPGMLTFNELLGYTFNAKLVFINGCETSIGQNVDGEGLNGLSRGFIAQGAGSVIGTLWPISDRVTPFFVNEFYSILNDTKGDVRFAASESQRRFFQEPKFRPFRHPYFWAAFSLEVAYSNSNVLF